MRRKEKGGGPIVVAWIGREDVDIMNAWRERNGLEAAPGAGRDPNLPGEEAPGRNGPIRALTDGLEAEAIWLLAAEEFEDVADMVAEWVERGSKAPCRIFLSGLENPESHAEACRAAEGFFRGHWREEDAARHVFHISSGTPAIQAAMFHMILARHPGGEIWRVEDGRRIRENPPFRIPARTAGDGSSVLAADASFQELLRIHAPVRSLNILLQGGPGSGVLRHARLIHGACDGPEAPFVHIRCAEIADGDEARFRSELFGRARGADGSRDGGVKGAFARAAGGTLFLEEVGAIPPRLQGILLRCLRERSCRPEGSATQGSIADVRIVASTARNLVEEVRAGRFLEELHAILAMCAHAIPPLREIAAGDAARFLEIAAGLLDGGSGGASAPDRPMRLSGEALRLLRMHSWPGGMQELERVLRMAGIRAGHHGRTELLAGDVIPHILRPEASAADGPSGEDRGGDWLPAEGLDAWITARKRELIGRALRLAGGSKAGASRLLGQPKHYLENAFKSAKLGLSKR